MDAALAREGRRAGKVFRGIDDHPARSQQQRLEDHRRDRLAAFPQRVAERVHARDPALRVRLSRGTPVAVRRGNPAGGEQDRPECAPERLHVADAHAPGGVPVVPVIEADEPGPLLPAEVAPALQGHLERNLHRRGAVVREEDARKPLRGDRGEPRGQPHRGLVGSAGEQNVVQPLHLPRHRLPDPRVPVPVDVAPPARDRVVIPVPLRVEEEQPLRAVDQHRRFRRKGARLGVRMPAVPQVPPKPGFWVHQVGLHRSRNARPTGANASMPRAGSDSRGTSPRTGACVISATIRGLSASASAGVPPPSPGRRLKTSPSSGIPRRRTASTVSSKSFTQPSRFPATTRTGRPIRATRSPVSSSSESGTRKPPAPSTSTASWVSARRRYAASITAGSTRRPSHAAARCGEAGRENRYGHRSDSGGSTVEPGPPIRRRWTSVSDGPSAPPVSTHFCVVTRIPRARRKPASRPHTTVFPMPVPVPVTKTPFTRPPLAATTRSRASLPVAALGLPGRRR